MKWRDQIGLCLSATNAEGGRYAANCAAIPGHGGASEYSTEGALLRDTPHPKAVTISAGQQMLSMRRRAPHTAPHVWRSETLPFLFSSVEMGI